MPRPARRSRDRHPSVPPLMYAYLMGTWWPGEPLPPDANPFSVLDRYHWTDPAYCAFYGLPTLAEARAMLVADGELPEDDEDAIAGVDPDDDDEGS